MILKGEALRSVRTHVHASIINVAHFRAEGADLERRLRIEGTADYLECPLTPEGIYVGDLVTSKAIDLGSASVQLVTRWAPQTQVVEFYDGPYDGMVRQVQRVGEPVHCYVGKLWPDMTAEESRGLPLDEVVEHKLTYRLEGWNLAKNLWAYRLDTPYLPARQET